MLLKKHMWNITGTGHYALLSAIWPGEGPVWEEVLWETTPVSVFCITQAQSLAISLPAPQLSLFVYLIYWRMPKRNRCCELVPLLYSSPLWKKSGLWSIELSECIIVIYGDLTFKLSFATRHYIHSFPEEKEEAQKGGKKQENVLQVDWPQPQIRNMGMSLNIDLFPSCCLSSLNSILHWVCQNINHSWKLFNIWLWDLSPIFMSEMDIISQQYLIIFFEWSLDFFFFPTLQCLAYLLSQQ